jgi:hypothetical protein
MLDDPSRSEIPLPPLFIERTRLVRARCRASWQLSIAGKLRRIAGAAQNKSAHQRRRFSLAPSRRGAKAQAVGNSDERRQIGQVAAIHS